MIMLMIKNDDNDDHGDHDFYYDDQNDFYAVCDSTYVCNSYQLNNNNYSSSNNSNNNSNNKNRVRHPTMALTTSMM